MGFDLDNLCYAEVEVKILIGLTTYKYLFLVMDYYQGKYLYALIDSDHKFSAPEIIYICRRLLKALKWLHQRA